MNQKPIVEIWLARDGQDPVLREIRTENGRKDFSGISGARDSMRAYCICLLLANERWNPSFPKARLDEIKIVEAKRSRREQKKKNLTFVNTVASLYISRGRGKGRAGWFQKLVETISDPIKGKYRDKKRDFVRVIFRPVWADYEWKFYTVGPSSDHPMPLRQPIVFAKQLEMGFGKWRKLLGKNFVIEKLPGTINEDDSIDQGEIASAATPPSLSLLGSNFESYLAKARHFLENGTWAKILRDPKHPEHEYCHITTRIGDAQRLKFADAGTRRSPSIPGDWRFLLESTHEAFLSANRRFPEIGRAFDSLVDALDVVDRVEKCSEELNCHFSRESWVREIGDAFPVRRIYEFLLFFTYLRIECPDAHRVSRCKMLFEKNVLFSLLNGYGPGINDCFFQFHGKTMFCRAGEIFRNRYYQEYVVCSGDTLQKVIRENYLDGETDFAACFRAFVKAHKFMSNVSITAPLLPVVRAAGRNSVIIVPPEHQNNNYQKQVDGMTKWREARNRDARGQ